MMKSILLRILGCFLLFVQVHAQVPDEAFFRAVQHGDAELVAQLLEAGAQVNALNEEGYSPLNYAAAVPNLAVLPLLLQYGAALNAPALTESPLCSAVKSGSYKHVMLLLRQGANMQEQHPVWGNLLYLAIRHNKVATAKLLLDKGLPISTPTQGAYLATHLAAARGANTILQAMLKSSGIDIDTRDQQGQSALHHAAAHNQASTCQLLIALGADVHATDSQGNRPLHLALQARAAEAAQILLTSGAQANALNANRNFPLHLAVQRGMHSTVQLLHSKGADLNVPNAAQKFALGLASQNGDAIMCRFLLRNGASPAAIAAPKAWVALILGDQDMAKPLIAGPKAANQQFQGMPYLSWAIRAGFPALAAELLQQGANPTKPDLQGNMPIHQATARNMPGIAALLLAKQIDINGLNGLGQPPLHIAFEHSRLEMANWLLSHGADANLRERQNMEAPLYTAMQAGPTFTRLILQQGVNLETVNKQDDWPLHAAVRTGNLEVVNLVLEAGAAINMPNIDGDTPLHLAARAGNTALVKAILRKGAALDITNQKQRTPLETAIFAWQFEVAKLLD